MAEKIKNNLTYVFCAALGITNFIWFAIPFMSAIVGINAYDLLSDAWSGGFSGVMCAIIALFSLIGTIAILAIGVIGLVTVLTDKTVNFDLKKIAKLALVVMAALSVLMLVFVIIFIEFEFSLISAGGFIWLVVCVGAFVADRVLDK